MKKKLYNESLDLLNQINEAEEELDWDKYWDMFDKWTKKYIPQIKSIVDAMSRDLKKLTDDDYRKALKIIEDDLAETEHGHDMYETYEKIASTIAAHAILKTLNK